MKLVVAIVQDYDTDRLLRAVTGAGIGATRIASTGGFLRTGNTTVLMGVEEERLAECYRLIRASCQSRIERPPADILDDFGLMNPGSVVEVSIGGAVVFVMPVSRFERVPAGWQA